MVGLTVETVAVVEIEEMITEVEIWTGEMTTYLEKWTGETTTGLGFLIDAQTVMRESVPDLAGPFGKSFLQ